MYYSLLFVMKKGLMLIAWSDHDGLVAPEFRAIPLINANALFWCYILHLYCEFL